MISSRDAEAASSMSMILMPTSSATRPLGRRRAVVPEQVPASFGVRTPRSASGISAPMISALKITAERMALRGVASPITLRAPSAG
jgi:hypothetical protein